MAEITNLDEYRKTRALDAAAAEALYRDADAALPTSPLNPPPGPPRPFLHRIGDRVAVEGFGHGILVGRLGNGWIIQAPGGLRRAAGEDEIFAHYGDDPTGNNPNGAA